MRTPEARPMPTPSTEEETISNSDKGGHDKGAPDMGTGDKGTPHTGSLHKAPPPREIGGREGPEPTRYGDWEVNGICSDF